MNEEIFISQFKYLKDMLKWFGMEECALVSTPMITRCKLSQDDESLEVASTLYKFMIRSILYLITSRPYIMQVVGMVVRFYSSPKKCHMQVVKRIF